MHNTDDAYVIYADFSAEGRSPTDSTFPWRPGEVIAVLPPDASAAERSAALAAIVQGFQPRSQDRSDILLFASRESHFYSRAADEHFDAFYPYLAVSRARNVRYVEAGDGEVRGHFEYEMVSG